MSKIDELLKNEKVEWKKLTDIALITGAGVDKKIKKDEKRITLLNYMDVYRHTYINSNIPQMVVTASDTKIKSCDIKQGDIFITPSSETKEDIFKSSVAIEDFEDTVYSYHIMRIRLKNKNFITSCFLNYIFTSMKFRKKMYKKVYGNTRQTIAKSDVEKLEIPIPSLETQEKIVEILDKFTNYVTELQAELQDRTKQYEYYRDMLLSEDYLNKKSKKYLIQKKQYLSSYKLEELVKFKNGKDWKILDEGTVPVYGSGGKMNIYVNKYSYNKPTVLIPRKGSIDNVFYLNEPFWNVDTIFYTEIDERKILPKYFYYFIENYDIKALSTDSTRPSLTQDVLNKIKINLPSLGIQDKVVEVLDKFQSLLADTEGLLPQEIEQRQKQYEYFREKLLTFDENVVSKQASKIISNRYFDLLEEACEFVGIKCFEVKNKLLKEISIFADGTHQTPKYRNNGIPFISVENIKNIYDTNKYISETDYNSYKYKPEKGDLFMTRIGDIGTCAVVEDNRELAYYVTLALIKLDKKNMDSKFLKFFIESRYGRKELYKRTLHTANPIKINLSDIGKIKIPVPPLAVQEHVVSILDKFDELINDISTGIPKEIELRQKEYEYYRERLLSFPR